MMKLYGVIVILICFISCNQKQELQNNDVKKANPIGTKSLIVDFANYQTGKTYLPVYSHIYHMHEKRTFGLTITASIRNISTSDTLYLLNADYYNTFGNKIRQYLDKPAYLLPLETAEIIIDDRDFEGGSGANFVFNWAMANNKNIPLFEAVMISTNGQQGISFTSKGVPITD